MAAARALKPSRALGVNRIEAALFACCTFTMICESVKAHTSMAWIWAHLKQSALVVGRQRRDSLIQLSLQQSRLMGERRKMSSRIRGLEPLLQVWTQKVSVVCAVLAEKTCPEREPSIAASRKGRQDAIACKSGVKKVTTTPDSVVLPRAQDEA